MKHWLARLHAAIFSWRHWSTEEFLALVLVLFVFTTPAAAAMRFEQRSLYMQSARPGATTSYTISFRYMSPQDIGSVDMLFCKSPIPYEPCEVPAGLDLSGATLTNQTGETGYSIVSNTTGHIILGRTAAPITNPSSSYTFTGIVNPTDTAKAFSIRLKSLGSSNGSGPQVDFGSVRGQVTNSVVLETQVPPMLMFCVAGEVNDDCTETNENYFADMGDLSPTTTLTAQSQMSVGTNASGGFAITANGNPMSAGTSVIDGISSPAASRPGTNQFGINLVANNQPLVGLDPQGPFANAMASPGYGTPNYYKYVPGDTIAYSPNVSLMKKFTVSYIVNVSNSLRAGVYSTTINYIASGRF